MFSRGHLQFLTVCNSSGTITIDTTLAVNDTTAGELLTWSMLAAPAHGTANADDTATSTGGVVTRSTFTYAPTSGYTGADTFFVTVTNGVVVDTMEINVTVVGTPDAGTISGADSICVGATRTYSSSSTDGTWSLSNTSASLSGANVTGSAAGLDTLVYTVSNACGTTSASKSIQIVGLTSAGSISGTDFVCAGATDTLSASVAGGSWSMAHSFASVSDGVVTGVSAGFDTVLYTVTAYCGSDVASFPIEVRTVPTVAALTGSDSICVGATTTISSGTSGGSWAMASTFARVSTAGVVNGTSAGNDTVIYSVSNVCGTTSVTKPVTVVALTDAGSITGASSVCIGTTDTLTATVSGGSWSARVGYVTVPGGEATALTVGTDTVVYTVSGYCGSATATFPITVISTPTLAALTGVDSICVGGSTTISESVTGGTWSATGSSISVSTAGVVTGVSTGIDTVVYSLSNTCGTSTVTKAITVLTLPSAGSVSGSATLCIGATDTLSTTITGGSWSVLHGYASISGGVLTGVSTGFDTVVYSVTGFCGTSTTSHSFEVMTVPYVSAISGVDTLCTSGTHTFTDSVAGGSWNVAVGHVSVTTGGVVTAVSAGYDTVIYSLSNSCGMTNASAPVYVMTTPDAGSITCASSVCTGATITARESVTGGTWSLSNTHATMTDSVITGATTGLDTLSYSLTNRCGTSSATHVISVITVPDAGTISGSTALCVGGHTTVSSTTTGGTWSLANATATLSADTLTAIAYGTETVSYIVSNACGADTATLSIAIDSAAPVAGSIVGRPDLCVGDTTHYTCIPSGGTWSVTNTAIGTIDASGLITVIGEGIDSVIYTVSNACGSNSSMATFAAHALPHSAPVTGYDSVCAGGGTITLSTTATGGRWISSQPIFANVDTTGVVTGNFHGSVDIFYIVSNSCGADTARHHVDINIPAGPIIGADTVCIGLTPSIFIDMTPFGTWSTRNPLVAFAVPLTATGTVLGITPGSTYLVYTVRNACGVTSDSMLITTKNCTADVDQVSNTTEEVFSVTPNPSSGNVNIMLNGDATASYTVTLNDVAGRKIATWSLVAGKNNEVSIDAPKGIYFMTADVKGARITKRIVIE